MAQSYFERVVRDADCANCNGLVTGTLFPEIEAVYCISLQEQPHRTAAAATHFHALGLCRDVTFYRPTRGPDSELAIWESHRAVAQDAVAKGFKRVLVLEDDVWFALPPEQLQARVAQALTLLPPHWWALYLGHVPLQGYFVRRGLLRIRAGCAHAYVANEPLLAWIARTEPASPEAPISRWMGHTLDCALVNLPEMYAMYPMVAVQRFLGDYRVNTQFDEIGRRRSLFDVNRWCYHFILGRGTRFAEIMAVLLSPLHWLTLEWSCRRVARQASLRARSHQPNQAVQPTAAER